ncbi:50S ribosomal protein L19 [Candidatus Roizmanbacteria bacterium CG11_big_fil_rev_8_21_14_0_20_36_8]|uniref:50S ribosomal protein L19 n=2 Tax=Candidatus Roizmaniibacteriota TaxID=1752723 RepID=A0A2M6ITE0_9BACT|nr:MAG: 50S ribosomal protein L19 [Candidatus Roizmanbacteria bacterium CG11_big_fil_rev_8_21_14_0_20_36_8]PIZ64337.1 MAG: 50S ribosomal protein L19 [Candidatus Roizmanbacteria bacterium CG_4_10_14_0_2_um_filter_36_9]
MANSVIQKDIRLSIGDTVVVNYKIKEANDKVRIQQFAGVVIKIRGASEESRNITVRKVSKSGIGVERIFPLISPFIESISMTKPSTFGKARAYFVRDLSAKKTRQKLYRNK